MEKLSMCRICLVEDIRMYVVTNKSLQEMYEKLVDIPFVTEDRRPMLACFYCCTKLKQCCHLQRKCVKAEKLLAQMLNEEYEQKPSWFLQGHQEFGGGLIITPVENISIVDECQIGSDAVKQEPAAVNEEEYDVELKLEHMSEGHDPENLDSSHPDVENVPAHHSESDSEDGELVMEIKIEGEEEQELSEQKQTVRETQKLQLENPDKSYPDVADIPAPNSESDSENDIPLIVIKTKEVSKKKRRASVTKSAPAAKKPKLVLPKEDTEKSVLLKHKTNGQKHSKHTENKDAIGTKSKENTASLQCDKIIKHEFKCKKCNYKGINISDIKRHSIRHNNDCAKDRPCKCDICQKSFTDQGLKQRHIRTHAGEKPHKCAICQSSFLRKSCLNVHIRTHTGEKPYKCDICLKSFNQNITLKTHIRTHTGEKPYKCDICQSRFNESGTLKTHLRTHTGEKPYKCKICQNSFTTKSILNVHIRTHTGEKPFKCDICQKTFAAQGYLKQHILSHTGEKSYKCDICQRSFTLKGTFNVHMRTHTGEKPYKCDICPSTFTTKGSLNVHIRTHTGEKPYKCNICQSSFRENCKLKTHIRTHTGEKPYKCDICQSSFSTKSSLNIHIRTHTGEKPYKCGVCQRSFNTRVALKTHIRTHTGEKSYKCDICQSNFNQLGNLKRHIRTHTGEKPFKCINISQST